MSNQENIFNREQVEYLCEVALLLKTKWFYPWIIHNIDSDFDFTITEALEFYEYVYHSLKDYRYSFLDELNNLSLKDITKLAEEYVKAYDYDEYQEYVDENKWFEDDIMWYDQWKDEIKNKS